MVAIVHDKPLSEEAVAAVIEKTEQMLFCRIVTRNSTDPKHISAANEYSIKIVATIMDLVTNHDFSTEKAGLTLQKFPLTADAHVMSLGFGARNFFSVHDFGLLIRELKACLVDRTLAVNQFNRTFERHLTTITNVDGLYGWGLLDGNEDTKEFRKSILEDVGKWNLSVTGERGMVFDLVQGFRHLIFFLEDIEREKETEYSTVDKISKLRERKLAIVAEHERQQKAAAEKIVPVQAENEPPFVDIALQSASSNSDGDDQGFEVIDPKTNIPTANMQSQQKKGWLFMF